MKYFKNFIKNETVLLISMLLAVISAFFVTPGFHYLDYIDFRTLALLFCLMAVMAGFNNLGIFKAIAECLIQKTKTVCGLFLILCLLCFFSSMLITNDVALITFVPFTIITLKMIQRTDKMIFLIVLETIAANLGSMLTPLGNPQNLYLFSTFQMSVSDFFTTILPYALLSLILIIVCIFFIKKETIQMLEAKNSLHISYKLLTVYSIIFILSLLTVFRILPYPVTFGITLLLILLFDRNTLLKVDYSLLLTFICLFVFIGNLGQIKAINDFLCNIVNGNEVISGILASQIFSNVPTTILLSGFTDNITSLLIGVNLGGLGTLIASMASLISYKFVIKENVKGSRYLLIFTLFNLGFLAMNLLLWLIIR